MKVFLSGYGKMGRMLEELALERGWEVVGHADITCPEAYETAPGAGKIEADVRAGGRFIGLGAGNVGMADDLPAALQRQLLEHSAHFAVSAQKYLHSAASCTGSPASRMMRFRRPRFSGAMGYIGMRKCPACRPIRFMAVFTGMGLTSMNRALMRSR